MKITITIEDEGDGVRITSTPSLEDLMHRAAAAIESTVELTSAEGYAMAAFIAMRSAAGIARRTRLS
jgi:hypothetical protein